MRYLTAVIVLLLSGCCAHSPTYDEIYPTPTQLWDKPISSWGKKDWKRADRRCRMERYCRYEGRCVAMRPGWDKNKQVKRYSYIRCVAVKQWDCEHSIGCSRKGNCHLYRTSSWVGHCAPKMARDCRESSRCELWHNKLSGPALGGRKCTLVLKDGTGTCE